MSPFFHSFKSHFVCLNHLMGTTTKSKVLIITQFRSFFRVSFINICVGQRHAYQKKKKKKKKNAYLSILMFYISMGVKKKMGVCLSNFYLVKLVIYYVYGSQLKPTRLCLWFFSASWIY